MARGAKRKGGERSGGRRQRTPAHHHSGSGPGSCPFRESHCQAGRAAAGPLPTAAVRLSIAAGPLPDAQPQAHQMWCSPGCAGCTLPLGHPTGGGFTAPAGHPWALTAKARLADQLPPNCCPRTAALRDTVLRNPGLREPGLRDRALLGRVPPGAALGRPQTTCRPAPSACRSCQGIRSPERHLAGLQELRPGPCRLRGLMHTRCGVRPAAQDAHPPRGHPTRRCHLKATARAFG